METDGSAIARLLEQRRRDGGLPGALDPDRHIVLVCHERRVATH